MHRGVEGHQHGQQVAGGGGGAEVAAQRPGVADLGGADGPGRVGQRGRQGGQVGPAEVGVGERGAEADLVAVAVPTGQFGHPGDGHHRARAAAAVVDLDHEVGPAGQHLGVGVLGQRGTGFGQAGGHADRHSPTLRTAGPGDAPRAADAGRPTLDAAVVG